MTISVRFDAPNSARILDSGVAICARILDSPSRILSRMRDSTIKVYCTDRQGNRRGLLHRTVHCPRNGTIRRPHRYGLHHLQRIYRPEGVPHAGQNHQGLMHRPTGEASRFVAPDGNRTQFGITPNRMDLRFSTYKRDIPIVNVSRMRDKVVSRENCARILDSGVPVSA